MRKEKPEFKNKPNTCHKIDGKEIWVSRSVAVVGCISIYFDDKYYILAEKRSKNMDMPGKWALPCGYLDYNESAPEAVIREVYEETGMYLPDYENEINFDSLKHPFRVNTNPDDFRQNISLCYGAELEIGIPIFTDFNKEECDEIKFICEDDIKNYDWAFEHDKVANEWFKYIGNNI